MLTVRARRRGVSSLLAMVYLVLFGVIAVGFYAQVNSNIQVAVNETHSKRAMLAAESGLAFARYHLSYVRIPPFTADEDLLKEIHADLLPQYKGSIGYQYDTQIEVPPGPGNYVKTSKNGEPYMGFKVKITRKADSRRIVIRTVGAYSKSDDAVVSDLSTSGFELEFSTQPRKAITEFSLASQGPLNITPANKIIQSNPVEYGNVLALGLVTIGTNTNTVPSGITGEITILDTAANPNLIGPVSVDGITDKNEILAVHADPYDNHVNRIKAADLPDFPQPNTAMFLPYATNTYSAAATTHDNIRIPPNTNPTFSTGHKVRGVVYVQQPNVVTFNGQVTMQCVIVTEDKNVGTLANNIIQMQGNGSTKLPLKDLPVVIGPGGTDIFEQVRELTGAFIIAPGFDVSLSGNFGAIVGDICGDRVTITGSSTVSITGNVFTLEPNALRVGGNAVLTLYQDPSSKHSGLEFHQRYVLDIETYKEINPN